LERGGRIMLQHEKNENANRINRFLHSRRYGFVKNWLRDHYGRKTVRILEIGVGYGRLFEELNDCLKIDYTGVELLEDFYIEANGRLGKFKNCRLLGGSILDSELQSRLEADYDVVIALETFEHIQARDVSAALGYIRNRLRCSYFLSSVPVELGCTILIKNLGSMILHYGRYREYTFKETLNAALCRLHKVSPHGSEREYPGHKGFDWRFYRYLLNQDFTILNQNNLPYQWLPANLSTNIMFVAQPRKLLS